MNCTEDSRRAALTQAAARRRGPEAEPLVGEATPYRINIGPTKQVQIKKSAQMLSIPQSRRGRRKCKRDVDSVIQLSFIYHNPVTAMSRTFVSTPADQRPLVPL